jgi:hypothetical protein
LRIAVAHRRQALLAALLLGFGCASASAASNQVYRCTGANGKVTLSDRRCPEDEPQAKVNAEAAKGAASGASPTASASKPEAKACSELKVKLADRRKQPAANDTERKALRQIEDETRRICGA